MATTPTHTHTPCPLCSHSRVPLASPRPIMPLGPAVGPRSCDAVVECSLVHTCSDLSTFLSLLHSRICISTHPTHAPRSLSSSPVMPPRAIPPRSSSCPTLALCPSSLPFSSPPPPLARSSTCSTLSSCLPLSLFSVQHIIAHNTDSIAYRPPLPPIQSTDSFHFPRLLPRVISLFSKNVQQSPTDSPLLAAVNRILSRINLYQDGRRC
jgi:hypothetical protein